MQDKNHYIPLSTDIKDIGELPLTTRNKLLLNGYMTLSNVVHATEEELRDRIGLSYTQDTKALLKRLGLKFKKGLTPAQKKAVEKTNSAERGRQKRKEKAKRLKLIEKLDRVFSLYIRLRDAFPHSGTTLCISCGRPHHWTKVDNGHYMSRRYMSTRFDPMNCHAQCKACNIFNQGNIQMYRKSLVRMYGEQEVNKLEARARVLKKNWSEYELEQHIKYYTALVEKLKAEKGL